MYSTQEDKNYCNLEEIIAERKYEIRIKAIDNTSPEEITHYGRYTTGDKEYDKALLEEHITRWMSIKEMVEYYKRGKPFSVVNVSDTEEIYTTIHQYLLHWKNRVTNSVNIGNAPIEELIHLDSFAAKIHGYACETMKVDQTQSSLVNYFNGFGLGRSYNAAPVENREPSVRTHNSLAEIFSEAIMGYRR
jgi:hypothetical protein